MLSCHTTFLVILVPTLGAIPNTPECRIARRMWYPRSQHVAPSTLAHIVSPHGEPNTFQMSGYLDLVRYMLTRCATLLARDVCRCRDVGMLLYGPALLQARVTSPLLMYARF